MSARRQYICEECGASLNDQDGFKKGILGIWKCHNCEHINYLKQCRQLDSGESLWKEPVVDEDSANSYAETERSKRTSATEPEINDDPELSNKLLAAQTLETPAEDKGTIETPDLDLNPQSKEQEALCENAMIVETVDEEDKKTLSVGEREELERRRKQDEYFKGKSLLRAQLREEENLRREREQAEAEAAAQRQCDEREDKRSERISFVKKHAKVIGAVTFIIFLLVSVIIFAVIRNNQRVVPFSSADITGAACQTVVSQLQAAGFKNVTVVPVEDLTFDTIELENQISFVSIQGNTSYEVGDHFSRNAKIIVAYHTLQKILIPMSSNDAKKQNYAEVEEELRQAGFVNISTVADCDLWRFSTKDGTIKEITVNGDNKFKSGDALRADAEIIITYHTFRSNKSDAVSEAE